MNTARICSAALCALGLCFDVGGQEQGIQRLSALGDALRSAEAWQAIYTQEYVATGMTAGEVVTGSVTVAWPDHAVFRTGEPVWQIMALDGRKVRLIDLQVPSCDEHLLDDDEWARVPLAAVLDPSGALDHFAVLDLAGGGFALEPRQPGGVSRVEVRLDSRSLPAEVIITDPQGSVNRLRFDRWIEGAPPEGDQWLPDPPEGLDCISDS
jgi:hypothetical protein